MMPKTCYLHIGSPKTGSTSIQAWCFRNKAALEDKGLLYPGTEQRHNALLSEFHNHPEDLRFNRMGTDLSQGGAARAELTAEYAEAAASSALAVLYSNENFLGQARHIRLEALQQELAQKFGELRILCYLRDPYKLLVSRAQEQIKSGVRTYEKVVARPPVLSMEALQDYARVFGQEALVLRNFDMLNAAGTPLLQDCLEAVLPGISVEEFAPTRAQNTGLSLEGALIMSGLNSQHGQKGDWAGRHLPVNALRGIGSTRFALPPEAVLQVRDQLLEQYEMLDKLGLSFSPPDWDALPEARPDWSADTLEQVALAMNSLAEGTQQRGRKAGRKKAKKDD